jgi:GH24 family phage-related lysozyme (muramidase)
LATPDKKQRLAAELFTQRQRRYNAEMRRGEHARWEGEMISPELWGRIRDDLNKWEDSVAWMYLDSVGLVTVGYGTMLPTAKAASAIPFYHEKTNKAATPAEVETVWNELHKGSAKQKAAANKDKFGAGHYQKSDDLRLTPYTASQLRDGHVSNDYTQLLLIYPDFDDFPDDAKLALFDMIYNLGAGHSRHKHHRGTGLRAYGTMNAAINSGDWKTAAKSCVRHGIPLDRNKETAQLFLNCAQ